MKSPGTISVSHVWQSCYTSIFPPWCSPFLQDVQKFSNFQDALHGCNSGMRCFLDSNPDEIQLRRNYILHHMRFMMMHHINHIYLSVWILFIKHSSWRTICRSIVISMVHHHGHDAGCNFSTFCHPTCWVVLQNWWNLKLKSYSLIFLELMGQLVLFVVYLVS